MPVLQAKSFDDAPARLQMIHEKLKLVHGSFLTEYPEQLMSVRYLSRDAKVLELGGNIGRNSCVIASILKHSTNFVTVESCPESAEILRQNRDLNGLKFHIEVSAVSKVPLIQKEWVTIPSVVDLPGFSRVNIISFDELQKKYNIKFNTLVADCEGALFYILLDDPGMLKNIKTVIIENDFSDIQQMLYVQELFRQNGLQLVYNEALVPFHRMPCEQFFYQVWKKL